MTVRAGCPFSIPGDPTSNTTKSMTITEKSFADRLQRGHSLQSAIAGLTAVSGQLHELNKLVAASEQALIAASAPGSRL